MCVVPVRGRGSSSYPQSTGCPQVKQIFERYVTGQESDRTTAEWLNANGATTRRGRRFGADTVREMLLNASHCGYVTGLRDQSPEIRGRHEPIVPEKLVDRVQEIRRWRTRIVKGGRAAEDYLLRQLLYCERCGARMQGTRGSRAQHRRYQCGTRRRGGDCTQRIVTAEPLERRSSTGLRDVQPDAAVRALVLEESSASARRSIRRSRRSPPSGTSCSASSSTASGKTAARSSP